MGCWPQKGRPTARESGSNKELKAAYAESQMLGTFKLSEEQ